FLWCTRHLVEIVIRLPLAIDKRRERHVERRTSRRDAAHGGTRALALPAAVHVRTRGTCCPCTQIVCCDARAGSPLKLHTTTGECAIRSRTLQLRLYRRTMLCIQII